MLRPPMGSRRQLAALLAVAVLAPALAGTSAPAQAAPYVEAASLTTAGGSASDLVGSSAAFDGDVVVLGVNRSVGAGRVYLFARPAGGWGGDLQQVAELVPTTSVALDAFGESVAIDGDTIVVGAPAILLGGRGAAYVYRRPAGGWSGTIRPIARLTASDGDVGAALGLSVAVSGSTIVAGASGADVGRTLMQGKAYVYSEPVGGWSDTTESAELTSSDGTSNDQFGSAVAADGDAVAVTAPGHASGSGAGYVYVRPGGGWSGSSTESARLAPSGSIARSQFGYAIAADGGTVAVGARGSSSGGIDQRGAVYVFERPGGGWSGSVGDVAMLTASDAGTNDSLGDSVAISGTTIAAGAPYAQIGSAAQHGAAYVYERPAGGWTSGTERDKLSSPEATGAGTLGSAVALHGSTVVAGAPAEDVDGTFEQGRGYLFALPPATDVAVAPATPDGQAGWYVTAPRVTVTGMPPPAPAVLGETRCALDPPPPVAGFGDLSPGCPYGGAGAAVPDGQHTVSAASITTEGAVDAPQSAALKVDTTSPTVACPSPEPAFAVGAVGAQVTATVADAVSGPAESTVSAVVDTSAAGRRTVPLTGHDVAGNSATADCPYVVGSEPPPGGGRPGEQRHAPPATGAPPVAGTPPVAGPPVRARGPPHEGPGPVVRRPPQARIALLSAADAVVRDDRLRVRCRARRGAIRSCAVTARRGATVLARGSARSARPARALTVRLRLTRAGERLVARALGGVPATLRASARDAHRRAVVRARTRDRLLAAVQRVEPPRAPLFGPYGDRLLPRGERWLRTVGPQLRDVRAIRCSGHTASVLDAPDVRYTDALGLARARAACRALRALGVRARFTTETLGKRRPRASNATAAGRAANRYVTLTIIR